MSNQDAWWLSKDGQKYGPYTEAQVRGWWQQGQLPAESLVWRPGTTDWVNAGQLFGGSSSSGAAPFHVGSGPAAASPSATSSHGTAQPKSKVTMTVSLSAVTVLIIGALLAIWFVPALGIGAKIQSECRVNGFGVGSCQFTNQGFTPGSACVDVKIVKDTGSTVSSTELCSGRVSPSDSVSKDVSLVINSGCDEEGREWTDVCHVDVEPE